MEFSSGIYYLEGKTWFPTQIVVTGELDDASHIWVKGVSDNLSKEDFRELLNQRKQMTEKEDRELADSVLEVSISANGKIVDELLGDESMYEALMEIMEPKLRIRDEKVRIKEAVDLLRDIQQTDQEIKKVIIKSVFKSLLANFQALCYHVFISKMEGFRKGGLIMQKNRQYQNKIGKLTMKGTCLCRYYR